MAFNWLESQVKRAAWALLALSVAGCGGERASPPEAAETPSPAAAAPEPALGGALVVAYGADVDTLNPVVASSDLSGQILDFLYPLLVTPRFDCRCRYEPGLAREWSWSDDGLTLTFLLREDVRWSDGEAVDADDVRFTLELIRDPVVASGYGSYLEHMRAEAPVETPDPHTVVVHFARRYDPDTMLSHVGSCPIVPQHALSDVARDELRAAPFGSSPVTAGPFRFERWERGQRLLLERDAAAMQVPFLDRVEFRVIPEYTTRVLELERGEVDLLPGLQVADAERLARERPDIRVIPRGHRYLDYIAWNLRDERFADERVRKALAHAVDADELIDALLRAGDQRFGARAAGTITPELCDLRDEAVAPIPHDLAAAAALFAEAGWTDSDGDGWLDRDGRRLAFTLETNGSNPRRVQAQVIVQEQLRRAGADVTLATHEGNTFFDRLKGGEFEAALTGWGAALVVDPSRLWKSDGVYNFPGYRSAEADALIERGLAATAPAEAASRWRELQALIHAAQPACFLYWRDELVAIHGRFADVGIDTLWLFTDLHRWRVPADQRRTR